jgi:hypothetical protein
MYKASFKMITGDKDNKIECVFEVSAPSPDELLDNLDQMQTKARARYAAAQPSKKLRTANLPGFGG